MCSDEHIIIVLRQHVEQALGMEASHGKFDEVMPDLAEDRIVPKTRNSENREFPKSWRYLHGAYLTGYQAALRVSERTLLEAGWPYRSEQVNCAYVWLACGDAPSFTIRRQHTA